MKRRYFAALVCGGLVALAGLVSAQAQPAPNTKECTPGPVPAGGTVTCTINLTNTGTTAVPFVLTDNVQDPLSIVPGSVSVTGPAAEVTCFANLINFDLACAFPNGVPPGQSAFVTYTVVVPAGTAAGPYLNTFQYRHPNSGAILFSNSTTIDVVRCTVSGSGVIVGTPGDDVICGSAGNDSISGGGGNDIIFGFGGNDSISGGAGNDIINGGAGNDSIIGGPGIDTANGDAGIDSCMAETTTGCP